VTATDWRTYDTPEAREAFQDAQERLDEGERQDGQPYTLEQRDEDEKLTDRYDRLVLGPAHYEFLRQCEEDEFARRFPEPDDGSRIEWEGHGGTLIAAFRQDLPEHEGGSWWLYGSDERYTWRHLVASFRFHDVDDLTLLVPVESAG
jgi:hypothetical protein